MSYVVTYQKEGSGDTVRIHLSGRTAALARANELEKQGKYLVRVYRAVEGKPDQTAERIR